MSLSITNVGVNSRVNMVRLEIRLWNTVVDGSIGD